MDLYILIIPLGIIAYSLLLLSFITGLLLFKFHVRWIKINWHISLAILAVILASLHAFLVFYLNR